MNSKITKPLLLILFFIQTAAAKEITDVANNFKVQKLAEGVYAVIRQDLPGLMVDANSVFIINDEDVVVVDTSGAPTISKAVLASLRKLTNKPVRFVINTHWHDDHIRGNQVYRDAFPGVDFIASEKMREYMPTTGASNRKQFLEGAPKAVEAIQASMQKNQNLSGGELTPEEKSSYDSDIRLVQVVLADGPTAETILPTIAVQDRLTFYRGDRIIDIRHMGSGHTAGDIVVHLPREGILITGDLVVWPIPLVGSDQSHVGEWGPTLEKLCALKATTIVPGHGPVLHDDSYLHLMAKLFASIQQQTDAAVARGETLEQANKSVDLVEFRKQFAGNSTVRAFLFDTYVASPAVSAAFREATTKPQY